MLAFGAGALISAVSFDLAEEGARRSATGVRSPSGSAVGAVTYYVADGALRPRAAATRWPSARSSTASRSSSCSGSASPPATGVSVGLLAAIFVSNLPEAIGSSDRDARGRHAPRRDPARCGCLIAVGCTIATPVGFAIADVTGGNLQAAIDGFAAGALLVMLIDSMIPEASSKAGRAGGLVTVLGFAVAAALSNVGEVPLPLEGGWPRED